MSASTGRKILRVLPYAFVALASFGAAYAGRRFLHKPEKNASARRFREAQQSTIATDSSVLETLGLNTGKQLIAYVFVSSRCGVCQSKEVKAALAQLSSVLRAHHQGEFRRISVVGVAVDADIDAGLKYLGRVDRHAFDEIDVGSGWMNEELVRHVWKEGTVNAALPQIIAVSRRMTGTAEPIELRFERDSVLRVLTGRQDVIEFVQRGAPLQVTTIVTNELGAAP